jgi:hypothetical protein
MSGAGVGASATRTGEAIYGAAGGGLVGTWALGSLVALRLDANVLAPISAPTFVALAPDGGVAGNLFRTSPAIFRLGIGVELRFF